MCLERQQDNVLRVEVGDPVGGLEVGRDQLLRGLDQLQPMGADRRQMRTTRDRRHRVPGLRQPHRHVAPDGACTDNADLHMLHIPLAAPNR